jgi:hypothetical protein
MRRRKNSTKVSTEPIREKNSRRVYTFQEAQAQQAFVEMCLMKRLTSRKIQIEMNKQFQSISLGRVTTLITRVRQSWKDQDDEQRPHRKAETSRRIFEHIMKINEELNQPDLTISERVVLRRTLISFENLFADVEDTRAPMKVEVDVKVRQSLSAVITALPPETMQEYLAEYQENIRLAAAYRAENNIPVPQLVQKTG